MMTSGDPRERSAAMKARVHRLSDPLAAMGQRSPSLSLQRERKARAVLLILTISATLTITGLIATVTDPPPSDAESAAERAIAFPGQRDRQPHVRTESS